MNSRVAYRRVSRAIRRLIAGLISESVNDVRGYIRRQRESAKWPDSRTATTIW